MRQFAAVALVLATLSGLMGAQSRGPLYPSWDVAVVAHRGLSAGFPENTLAAFRNVIASGVVDAIELDLRGTADGEAVVLHDDTLDRTTDGRGRLAQMRRFWNSPRAPACNCCWTSSRADASAMNASSG